MSRDHCPDQQSTIPERKRAGETSSSLASRRGLLASVGSAATLGVAGCLGSGDSGGAGGSAAVGATPADHALAARVEEYPHRGVTPFEGAGTLFVLDDPRCPLCASYHNETVAEYKQKIVEPGDGTLVAVQYPVTYETVGLKAANALRATYERDEAAFWGLQDYLFNTGWNGDTIYDVAASWLAENTGVDAEAVADEARQGKYEGFIQKTIDAANQEGASSTPYVFLFNFCRGGVPFLKEQRSERSERVAQ
jgi:protein-disulfide isomerase